MELPNYFIMHFDIFSIFRLHKKVEPNLTPIHGDKNGPYGMEKAMAPYSSTLAWNIPWAEEPGRLQSMGSLGVGHD